MSIRACGRNNKQCGYLYISSVDRCAKGVLLDMYFFPKSRKEGAERKAISFLPTTRHSGSPELIVWRLGCLQENRLAVESYPALSYVSPHGQDGKVHENTKTFFVVLCFLYNPYVTPVCRHPHTSTHTHPHDTHLPSLHKHTVTFMKHFCSNGKEK